MAKQFIMNEKKSLSRMKLKWENRDEKLIKRNSVQWFGEIENKYIFDCNVRNILTNWYF